VVGPNGAGKSTLLDLLAGRLAPLRGRVELAPALRGRVAHLPQRPTLDTSFPVSVLETVMLGHWRRLGAFGWVRRAHIEQARVALEQVGLGAMAGRLIGELSAGQLQRLLFARLALLDASLVLLDEPFAAVDAATTATLLGLLRQWRDDGRTVVAVTHDLPQVRAQFDHAVLLAGRVVASGAPAVSLADEPLAEAGRLAWTLA
jgi:zinc/manganese transport system ATP-binding protein